MFRIKKIDHVAIAVENTDEALARYREVFGLEATVRETVASQKTEATLLPLGETSLELIEPKGNDGLRKFLDKRGPGLHHIAIEVEGIEAALTLLASLGVPLIDATPRIGARGVAKFAARTRARRHLILLHASGQRAAQILAQLSQKRLENFLHHHITLPRGRSAPSGIRLPGR